MPKNLIKKILEGTVKIVLAGTLLFGNPYKTYAPPQDIDKEVLKEYFFERVNFRKLSDSKATRKITKDKKPWYVKKTNPTVVSYAWETDTLYIPEYRYGKKKNQVKADDCGKYSSNIAEDLFGIEYNRNHTWNLKKDNKVVRKLDKGFKAEDLDSLANERILQPGMKVICHNPNSKYNWTPRNKHKDNMGNKVDVTHDINYIGQDISTGSALFSHLWTVSKSNFRQEIININDLKKYGLQPREIIDVPDKDKEYLAQNRVSE